MTTDIRNVTTGSLDYRLMQQRTSTKPGRPCWAGCGGSARGGGFCEACLVAEMERRKREPKAVTQ